MKIVNLTPHELNVRGVTGTIFTFPPSGQVARCVERRVNVGRIGGIDVSVAEYGDVQGLPDPEPNTIFIVSAIVLMAVPHRRDVFAPGPAVRNDLGLVVGCDGLSGTPAMLPQQSEE